MSLAILIYKGTANIFFLNNIASFERENAKSQSSIEISHCDKKRESFREFLKNHTYPLNKKCYIYIGDVNWDEYQQLITFRWISI